MFDINLIIVLAFSSVIPLIHAYKAQSTVPLRLITIKVDAKPMQR
jgi:hypothetical protein